MTTKKVKFTDEEEERIIDFVKTNEVLFNVKHAKFRDSEAKNRLWLSLAKELNKEYVFICILFLYRVEIFIEFISMFISS